MHRALVVLVPLGVAILGTPAVHAQQAVVAGAYVPGPVAVGLSVHWRPAAPAPVVIARVHAPAVVIAASPAWVVHDRPHHHHRHRHAVVPYPAQVYVPAYGYGPAYGHPPAYGYGPAYGHPPAYGYGPTHGYGSTHAHPPSYGHDHGRHDPDWNGPYRPWRH